MCPLPSNELCLIGHILWSGRTALDIGANIGNYTELLLPGYRNVYAFEPHPDAISRFLERFGEKDGHKVRMRVPGLALLGVALWSENLDRLPLHTFWDSSRTSAVFEESTFGSASTGLRGIIYPRAVTLDSFNIKDVDFIKVDVEGAEYEVLMGAAQTIERERPRIIVEVHTSQGGQKCRNFLRLRDYRVERVEPDSPAGGEAFRGEHYWLVGRPR